MMADARCSELFWQDINSDRPEHPGISHVHDCTASGSAVLTIIYLSIQ